MDDSFYEPHSRPTYPLRDEDVAAVDALIKVAKEGATWENWATLAKARKSHPALYKRVADVSGADRGHMALAILERVCQMDDYGPISEVRSGLVTMATRLIGDPEAVTPEQFEPFVGYWRWLAPYHFNHDRAAGLAERLVAKYGLLPELEPTIRKLLAEVEATTEWNPQPTTANRRFALRYRQLLEPQSVPDLHLSEPWQTPFAAPRWAALLRHAKLATGPKMAGPWESEARRFVGEVGEDAFLDTFGQAVDAVVRMPGAVDTVQADMLRGLTWMAGFSKAPRMAAHLRRLAVACAHKVVGIGPRCPKVFNAAATALEGMGTHEALMEIANARGRVKYSLVDKLTDALIRAAQAQAIALIDLEEMLVPTFDLEVPGWRGETLGTVEAKLEIVGPAEVTLRWFRDGKELKSPPAEVKRGFGEELTELKWTAKEIGTALAPLRARLEGMMMSGRTLPYLAWRERYLHHPLLAFMSRRLIWRFEDSQGERLGIAPDGTPVDANGSVLEGLGEGTTVRLWHPIHATAAVVEMWREFLVSREIRQPFKQAHREVYRLTAAEERTNTYSNRFAGHILKQHQFAALADARGWGYRLQGDFDGGGGNALCGLFQWGMTATYFSEIVDAASLPDRPCTSDMGIALYISTDQVRFEDTGGHPVPLANVPPVVFSEVMRDVDLFVGVASVGNDPNWTDQGNRPAYGDYWRQAAFGELSTNAETRRAVLERLLPRLAIAKVAHMDGRFLVVKGKRRTYKIHLGSGNILMEPNDQYLCIVADGGSRRSSEERVYLPFEGDGVLQIILSKAMMLANDDKITDPTILQQLEVVNSW